MAAGDIPDTPIVMVANHPYGIGDGIAFLSLAEQLGRPFRVIINNDLSEGSGDPALFAADFVRGDEGGARAQPARRARRRCGC
jgi:putative hemolysin